MKLKSLILLLFLAISFISKAQIIEPVTWEFDTKDLGNGQYELYFIASMEEKWALYSQFVDEGGPIPTSFDFQTNEGFEKIEAVVELEENKVTKNDPIFDMVVSKFYDKATFVQKIKLLSEEVTISGFLTYQACDDEKCLMPTDVPFVFNYSSGILTVATADLGESIEVEESVNQLLYGLTPDQITSSDATCETDVSSLSSDVRETKSLWNIFGLGFLGGLLALLTPCVFPMIPLTVSFFTKKGEQESQSKGFTKAVMYGVFILLVYLVLSIPFHLLDSVNPDILNEISTNVVLNIIFFLIFVFFAFSFFGYYELTLPSSWTMQTTKGENIGGMLGVFFMALTLAIVSFSWTGPILGSLLAGSLTTDGGAWQLTAGMGGFGVALGLPFALFAAFPGWLNSLPKSGGWLNTVKVVLGFLELALAFKFLSNADLVKHWGILKIEVFLGIWILIFAGLALYLFGKVRFPHDSPLKKLSFLRLSTGVLSAAFVLYLASGFRMNSDTGTYKSLTMLSGLAPPVGYSYLHPNECPNDLNCFKDIKEGIAYAQKVNKPIILDFTGYACVNCRKMEEHVWPDETINTYLKEEYVLISLYVDDKKTLPEAEQVTVNRVNGGTRKLENYGHKWANFQTQFFQSNSQPYYVLLSPDGRQILNPPVGYTPDESDYADFLQCGLEIFQQSQGEKSLLNFTSN
ncbi:MAG: DUF255 domain-containing protein [Flavobacteriaceae bacterium]|nr:DUF255 domain-containing protein [Flavobacteriaceae bacterium]